MRCWKAFSASLISLGVFAASAQAATSFCTTPEELSALRTAALQQELMVAGLTCQATDAYNRFVLAYRSDLLKSDADLKAYFVRRDGARGEADYDTFKTKLANLSSLSDIANSSGYCANARAAFDMVMQGRQSLASFVADQRLLIALPEQQLCMAPPTITAAAEPAQPLRLAAVAPTAVAGMPSRNPPASPYGAPAGASAGAHRSKAAPPPPPGAYQPPPDSEDNDEDYDDEDEDAAPIPPALQRPERPAVIQAQRDQAYGPTGWPPGWEPWPDARWYDQRGYYYYGR